MKRILNWLDDRTGYRELKHEFMLEDVPGGARWRYVWGSTLVLCFFVQVTTGFFLWAAYSPSALAMIVRWICDVPELTVFCLASRQ